MCSTSKNLCAFFALVFFSPGNNARAIYVPCLSPIAYPACRPTRGVVLPQVMEEVSLLKVASKHPNVVSLQAFFEDQEAFYIVMEMCEGGELYHRLADKVSLALS